MAASLTARVSMRRPLLGLLGFSLFVVAWEALSQSGIVRQEFLPPPSTVALRLVELATDSRFVVNVVATVLAWAIALGIATAVAVPLGLVLGTIPAVRKGTAAIIEFLRPIPSVALIPLAIVLLGTGPETKITLAVYAAVWPLLLNTIQAMSDLDPVSIDTARSFGFSRRRIVATVAVPHAAPFVLTGVRISAAIALILIVSTELLAGGSGGIGQFVFDAGAGGGRMDLVLAGTVVAGLLGLAANAGLEQARRRWCSWADAGEDDQ